METEHAGRVYVVVGGGSGIGAATATLLRERGADVMVVGRRLERVEAVATATGAVAFAADAAKTEDCAGALASALARWGRVDSLVVSSGSGNFADVESTSDEEWARVMRTNVESAFVATRAFLPALRETRGSIVLVSSVAGVIAPPGAAAYVASKHALVGLGRSLAVDAGPAGVRTNIVCPWLTRTDMSDEVMSHLGGDAQASYAKAASLSPSRRVLDAVDVAEIVAFLACPRAAAVNGAVVMADGGMTAYDLSVAAMVAG